MAPRVAVRSHIDWRWYGGGLVLASAAVWGAFRLGSEACGGAKEADLAELRDAVGVLEGELAAAKTAREVTPSLLQIEKGGARQLLEKVHRLEAENAALKEDLAFFEKLVPMDAQESVVRVERFRMIREGADNHYRYRLLLAFQPTRQGREFRARLRLKVGYVLGGKEMTESYPASERDASYSLEVRQFLRKEGVLALPAGADVHSVEVVVLQDGQVRVRQVFKL